MASAFLHSAKLKEELNPVIEKLINTDEEMLKTVHDVLNKLTSSAQFDKLLGTIQKMNISTDDQKSGVIELLFEKAVKEPMLSRKIAEIYRALILKNKEVASSANSAETANFRNLLLKSCEKEFGKDRAGIVAVKKKEIERKKKELDKELEELVNINRRRALGNIRILGELFKLRMISVKVIDNCIRRLLIKPEDEESIECLCLLLTTVGNELEIRMQPSVGISASTSLTRDTINWYFTSLVDIVQKRKISNRIRFLIEDVVDLRKSQWKPRHDDNAPKTINQFHRDVHKDQERQFINPQFQRNMGDMSRDGRMGDRWDRDDRNRKQSHPNNDGWNMANSRVIDYDYVHSVNRGGNFKLETRQLWIPKDQEDTYQGAMNRWGPGVRGRRYWNRGFSSDMSLSLVGGTQETWPNRYHILENNYCTYESGKASISGPPGLGGPPQSGRVGSQDYRTMPGTSKSTFFPSKFSDCKLDFASCYTQATQHPDLPVRSHSQQSLRENSVILPISEIPQPIPLSCKVSKDVLLGKSIYTDDEIKGKALSLLGDNFTNESIQDAIINIKDWLQSPTVARFIYQCLLHMLKRNRTERRATGTLFKEMVARKLLTTFDIMEGYTELIQLAEYFLVDVSEFWEYTAELVEPLFEEGVINLKFLLQLSSILNSSLADNFIAAVLKELVKAQGIAGAERIWIMSNVPLAILLRFCVEPNAFLAQHKELEFLWKIDSTPRDSNCVVSKSNSNSTSQLYLDFQHNLEQYLRIWREANLLTAENVCSWIQEQNVGEVDSAFIRAVGTAVVESSIEGRGADSKLNNSILKHWAEVLRRYVNKIADRELQLLFAVQILVTKRQHAKGLIQGIIETLYESSVVSEEVFQLWESNDDPSEREGKAVTLKSLTSFLTWVKGPIRRATKRKIPDKLTL